MKLILIVFISSMLITAVYSKEVLLPSEIDVVTNNLPFMMHVSENRKTFVDVLLNEIFIGHDVEINTNIEPYIRSKMHINNSDSNCFALFPTAIDELVYAKLPWAVHEISLYGLVGSDTSAYLRSTSDLASMVVKHKPKVGVIAGMDYSGSADIFVDTLKSSQLLSKSYGDDAFIRSLKMLHLGRHDIILACPLWVGVSQRQLGPNTKELVEIHKFPDTRLELHFACKKSGQYSQEIINIVDKRLPLLIRDGTWDRILEHFNLPKVSPVAWHNINLNGTYSFSFEQKLPEIEEIMRPLTEMNKS